MRLCGEDELQESDRAEMAAKLRPRAPRSRPAPAAWAAMGRTARSSPAIRSSGIARELREEAAGMQFGGADGCPESD
jgi:hypothetical protein